MPDRITTYVPGGGGIEGGMQTASGQPMYTYQQYLAGQAPYVTAAAAGRPSLDYATLNYQGQQIPIRYTDTGGGLVPGQTDIAMQGAQYRNASPFDSASIIPRGNSGGLFAFTPTDASAAASPTPGTWWTPPTWTRFLPPIAQIPLGLWSLIAGIHNRALNNANLPGATDLSGAPPVANPDWFPIGGASAGTDVLGQDQGQQQQQGRDPFQYILNRTPYLSARENPLLAGSTFGGAIGSGFPEFSGYMGLGSVGGGGPYWHLLA